MGLYLMVLDGDEELDGVEVGGYDDFGAFRDAVTAEVEGGEPGSVCPVLIIHSDCDGWWAPTDSAKLLIELQTIEKRFRKAPPIAFNSDWKRDVARTHGMSQKTLADCFFDVNGEPLIARLRSLAQLSVVRNLRILFQ